MTKPDTSQISDKVIEDIVKKVRGPARAMWAIAVALVGAILFFANTVANDATHEADQDRKIDANGDRADRNERAIYRLAVLHMEQGRYMITLARAAAPVGTEIPDRPAALIAAEQELILRGNN